MDKFTHLHTHTKYSLNDAMIDAKKLAKRLKEQGVTKYAITEHGVMMNMPEAYIALKDEGIELIVGMEAYVAPRDRTQKEGRDDATNNHLVLLCKNNEGYDNLKIIASDAALNGFYYKPRTDREFLRKHSNGLIALSACLGGSINKYLMANKYDEAKKDALNYLDIFGEGNFFLEIQRHGIKEQEDINPLIMRLSRETGIPLVATNDNHYLDKEDWEAHDIQMAIQAATTVKDTKRKIYSSHEFYVKSPEEMERLFADIPEAISNTIDIANRCHVELEFGVNKIPPYTIPKDYNGTGDDLLKDMIYKGAIKLYGEITDEIRERIEFEYSVIHKMGYVNYFLITWDVFRFCKEGTKELGMPIAEDWDPILTGPGRGSAAGSIVSFCLGITKIDPLKYGLLFERFLAIERISMPDIDSDFDSNRRQEVIDYVVYKYGRESISQIITFGTLAARAVIRKVGKALDMPLSMYDKIAKMIPTDIGIKIVKALEINQDLRKAYLSDPEVKKLLDFSVKLEGLPTNCSTHAAGVLITDSRGVTAHVPLWKNDSGIVAQFDMGLLEKSGLLKMDFLALKTIGVFGNARKSVMKNYGVNIDIDELYTIPTLDPLKLIGDGKTECLFQLAGGGMTGFMKELKPSGIEDIIAGISMYRPGPMNEIPRFLHQKRNPSSIHYDIDGLGDILNNTYGVIVYQEQCMQIVVQLAGFSRADSDNFRRIVSKKKLKEMPKQREWFINGRKLQDYDYEGKLRNYKTEIPGGIALGHSKEALNKLFDLMVDFAAYAFNKSHAAAYAYIAYITAWAMYYYPTEFMAANLTMFQGNRPRMAKYINYCRKVLNIEIVEPDINISTDEFNPLPSGKIVYTLAIKGAGTEVLRRIVEERENNGLFESLSDFLIRTRSFLDKGTYEGLIGAGAFKCFGVVKSQHLAALDEFWDIRKKAIDKEKAHIEAVKKYEDKEAFDKLKKVSQNAILKKIDFDFETELMKNIEGVLPEIKEFPKDIELRLEKELLGLYLTNNPLYKYSYTIQTKSNFEISTIEYDIDEETGVIMLASDEVRDRQPVRFVAMLNDVFEITTKKKTLMCRMEIEDLTGIASALVWPNSYEALKPKLKPGEIYMCYGSLKISADEAPIVIIDDVELMDDIVTERLMLTVDNGFEAREIINHIKTNRIAQGLTPIYLIHEGKQVLLTREYWINTNYMTEKYGDKTQIKTW